MSAYNKTMFLIAVAVWIHTVSANEYFLSRSDRTWDYTNPPCNVATPPIVYTAEGPTVELPNDVNIASTAKVLVGYTKTFEVFQYIGCIRANDVPKNVPSHTVYSDPGQCFSFCQTSFFGLYMGQCFCSDDEPKNIKDTYSHCLSRCVYPQHTVCGGRAYVKKYVSVYKSVPTSSKGLDDGMNCRIYDRQSDSFTWQSCETQLLGLCQTTATNTSFTLTSLVDNIFRKTRWDQYPNDCFSKNMYPATEEKHRIKTELVQQAWTGQIKSWAIVNISYAQPNDFAYGYYGYITKRSKILYLEFTKERSGPVLCLKGGDNTVVTTEETGNYVTSGDNTVVTTEETGNYVTNAGTTMVTPYPRGSQENESTEKDGSPAIIAVYVVVPLVLLVAAVVAVVIVLWKRKQTAQKGTQRAINSNGNGPIPAADNALTNATYVGDFVASSTETECNDYHELEPQYDITADPESNKNGDNETAFVESVHQADNYCEQTYDTTNAVTAVNSRPNGNVYNTVSAFDEDTYNHAGEENETPSSSTNQPMTRQANDNTYNHINKEKDNGNVYNTVNVSSRSQHNQMDDTYNHIGYD